jgi:hypothetical protein
LLLLGFGSCYLHWRSLWCHMKLECAKSPCFSANVTYSKGSTFLYIWTPYRAPFF